MPHRRFADTEKVRQKYICPRRLRRILNKGINYENTYAFAGNGFHARLEFMCLGTGHNNDEHNPRDHCDTTDCGTADHNHSHKRRLLIRQNICSHRARVD